MSDTTWGRAFANLLLDALVPFTVFLMILLTTLPVGLPIGAKLGGLAPLIAICYWTLVRPRELPPLMTFCMGVVTDLFLMTPLGVHAFVFVLAQTLLIKERRFLMGQGFWVLWAAFFLLAGGCYILLWGIMTLFAGGHVVLPFWRGIFSVGLSWALMPLVILVLGSVEAFIDLFQEPGYE